MADVGATTAGHGCVVVCALSRARGTRARESAQATEQTGRGQSAGVAVARAGYEHAQRATPSPISRQHARAEAARVNPVFFFFFYQMWVIKLLFRGWLGGQSDGQAVDVCSSEPVSVPPPAGAWDKIAGGDEPTTEPGRGGAGGWWAARARKEVAAADGLPVSSSCRVRRRRVPPDRSNATGILD
jgi:hypothetical protein